MYHGQRNCFSKVLNIVHIFNRSAATTTVHVRWLYRKVRQQHQVSILYSIVTICICITPTHISFIGTTKFYLCRVVSFGSHVDGTRWKEDIIWRKAINDNLNTLFEKKQWIGLPSGGAKIIASPSLQPIIIPFELRQIPVNQWRQEDRIWLNM